MAVGGELVGIPSLALVSKTQHSAIPLFSIRYEGYVFANHTPRSFALLPGWGQLGLRVSSVAGGVNEF